MIEVQDLTRSFIRRGARMRALDGLTFAARAGEVTALVGPNGSGKTTLLMVLAGLIRPDSGRALVEGRDVTSHPLETRRRIGLMPDEPCLQAPLTPLWHVALHASLRGAARPAALARAERALARTGLSRELSAPMGALSRGQRGCVALARALVSDPPVLLLDEPTAHLDIETAARVREVLRERARRGGCLLVATHDLRLVEDLCGMVVVMGRGTALATGSPAELTRRAAATSLEEACRRIGSGQW